eukprot:354734-Chlamydomonas_euryale.AAC.8
MDGWMDVPERRNGSAAPEAAASAPSRVAVEPQIAVAARPQTWCTRVCRRTRGAAGARGAPHQIQTAMRNVILLS